jgi:hypothetical protein
MTHPARLAARAGLHPAAFLALAAALALSLGVGASEPVPNEQMAVAQAAVTRASTVSTGESAAPELRVAVDKLAAARAALARGETDLATRLTEQAELDAQVAELHAQSVRSRRTAQESEDAARALREEINRKPAR